MGTEIVLCIINNNHIPFTLLTGWVIPGESTATLHHILLICRKLTRSLTFFSTPTVEREEVQMVCAGKEFRLPVYSTSRTVIFTPNPEGHKRVLLEKTTVKQMFLCSCLCLFCAQTT